MSKISKTVSMILASVMIVSLAACGSSGEEKENNAAQPAETKQEVKNEEKKDPVKLKLLTISTDESRISIMDNFIKQNYKKELPDVEIEFEPGGGGEDMANKLKTYNASGDMPDVWYSDASFATPIIKVGNQLDLTPYITKDGFIEKYSVKDALKFKDGKIYAIGAGADTFFNPRIFYHKDIFAEHNIQVPETFDELIEVCKKLNSAGVVPVSTMGKGGWAPGLFLFQTMVQIEDPEVMSTLLQNKMDFNNPVIKKALGRIEKLAKEGAFPKGIATLDYGPAKEMFTSKKAAMYWMFSWELPSLTSDPDVDFFLWPSAGSKYNAKDVVQFWGSPISGYAVFANSKNLEAAVKLAEFCAMQDALFFTSQGSPVDLNTGSKLGGVSPLMQKNLDDYNGAKTKISSFYLNAMDAKTNAEFGKLSSNLLTGDYSADQFVKDFNNVWLENTWFKD